LRDAIKPSESFDQQYARLRHDLDRLPRNRQQRDPDKQENDGPDAEEFHIVFVVPRLQFVPSTVRVCRSNPEHPTWRIRN
jgi:hypothetical protein